MVWLEITHGTCISNPDPSPLAIHIKVQSRRPGKARPIALAPLHPQQSLSWNLQKQGRFEVYEGDMSMSPPVGEGVHLLEQHLGGNRAPEQMNRSPQPFRHSHPFSQRSKQVQVLQAANCSLRPTISWLLDRLR